MYDLQLLQKSTTKSSQATRHINMESVSNTLETIFISSSGADTVWVQHLKFVCNMRMWCHNPWGQSSILQEELDLLGCNMVQSFWRTHCLHLKGQRVSQGWSKHETGSMHQSAEDSTLHSTAVGTSNPSCAPCCPDWLWATIQRNSGAPSPGLELSSRSILGPSQPTIKGGFWGLYPLG
jgi:hypothetical protein